jgi:hypothetical protein
MSLGLNPTEQHETFFDSVDISDCLEHYLATGEIDNLYFAINLAKGKQAKAFDKLDFLIDLSNQLEHTFMANSLTTLKNTLR